MYERGCQMRTKTLFPMTGLRSVILLSGRRFTKRHMNFRSENLSEQNDQVVLPPPAFQRMFWIGEP